MPWRGRAAHKSDALQAKRRQSRKWRAANGGVGGGVGVSRAHDAWPGCGATFARSPQALLPRWMHATLPRLPLSEGRDEASLVDARGEGRDGGAAPWHKERRGLGFF